ncbi:putative cell division protein ZapA [Candidatus Hepatincolaceae symbiont of Richtersius coronifer]
MTIVEIKVNNKLYQIGCELEDETKIIDSAKLLNEKIELLKSQSPSFFMNLNNELIFLFQLLLTLSDDISNTDKASFNQNLDLFEGNTLKISQEGPSITLNKIEDKISLINVNINKLKKLIP